MTSDLLALVLRANLVAAVVILVILALRPLVTQRFGARVTYALWAVAPLAVLASLIPARRVVVEPETAAALVAAQRAALAPPNDLEALVPDAVHVIAPTFDPDLWLFAAWALGVGVSLLILVQRQAR